MSTGKALIVSAPSGAGKTTLITHLRGVFPELAFSVSACSRSPRSGEVDGRDYYFLSESEFRRRVEAGDFLEWEEVYAGQYYGTLYCEVRSLWDRGKVVLFDIDVRGALNLKQKFGDAAFTLFITPPSVSALRDRLLARGLDSVEAIEVRVAKASEEIGYAGQFDAVVVNDDLETARREVSLAVSRFLGVRG